MTLVAVVVFVAILAAEVEKFANILEALSTGIVRRNVEKKDRVEKVNWKEAYAAR